MSPGLRVVLKRNTAREGAWVLTGIKFIQKSTMIETFDTDRCGVRVVEGPADIVMAAR
jgi:hypothetical protein